MADGGETERATGPGGSSYLGVQRMEPREDGIHLIGAAGEELGVTPYGQNVYINGRVMSFRKPGTPGYGRRER